MTGWEGEGGGHAVRVESTVRNRGNGQQIVSFARDHWSDSADF